MWIVEYMSAASYGYDINALRLKVQWLNWKQSSDQAASIQMPIENHKLWHIAAVDYYNLCAYIIVFHIVSHPLVELYTRLKTIICFIQGSITMGLIPNRWYKIEFLRRVKWKSIFERTNEIKFPYAIGNLSARRRASSSSVVCHANRMTPKQFQGYTVYEHI